jgi:hypothetical protein
MRRCDYCGGKFGLIIHRKWTWRFCKLACKRAYEDRRREEMQRQRPWLACCSRFPGRGLHDGGSARIGTSKGFQAPRVPSTTNRIAALVDAISEPKDNSNSPDDLS